jgi:hypothetical protein
MMAVNESLLFGLRKVPLLPGGSYVAVESQAKNCLANEALVRRKHTTLLSIKDPARARLYRPRPLWGLLSRQPVRQSRWLRIKLKTNLTSHAITFLHYFICCFFDA